MTALAAFDLDDLRLTHNVSAYGWRAPLIVRLLRRVEQDGECWRWAGSTDRNGYGAICASREHKMLLVHRVAYALFVGPIPSGLELDHLCRVRNCFNPAHLEVVTRLENVRRSGPATKTACKQGHPYTPENIAKRGPGNTYRDCKACHAESGQRQRDARKRAQREATAAA